jgi:cereblon
MAAQLAQGEDLIQVVDEGPCVVCVNPGGYAHKIICLRDLKRGVLVGPPSTEASWFPGYAWQMVQCACAQGHLVRPLATISA